MDLDDLTLRETRGSLRVLTAAEMADAGHAECCGGSYRYVIVEPYTLRWRGRTLVVPAGFQTDGSSGGPDYGTSWIYHDYIYTTHRFTSGEACTREEADLLMGDVLAEDRMYVYCRAFLTLSKINPFWLFSKAWHGGGAVAASTATAAGLVGASSDDSSDDSSDCSSDGTAPAPSAAPDPRAAPAPSAAPAPPPPPASDESS